MKIKKKPITGAINGVTQKLKKNVAFSINVFIFFTFYYARRGNIAAVGSMFYIL